MNKYRQGHMKKDELKQNKLVDMALNFRHYAVKHKKHILTGVTVFFVLCIALIWYVSDRRSTEATAQARLAVAYEELFEADGSAAIDSLNEVIEEFPGTYAADKARFHLGNVHVNLQQYDEAIELFEYVVDSRPSTYLYPLAVMAAGDALVDAPEEDQAEKRRQLNRAVQHYERLAQVNQGFRGTALYKKAHVQLAMNDFIAAERTIEALKNSPSEWSEKATMLSAYMKMLAAKAGESPSILVD